MQFLLFANARFFAAGRFPIYKQLIDLRFFIWTTR